MWKIAKEFHFSASHSLVHLPSKHPCSRVHGHNYTVIVEFEANVLNKEEFVVDYRALDPIKKWIDDKLDHKHLNDVFVFHPTSENMAKFLFKYFSKKFLFGLDYAKLCSLTIKETEKTYATYEHEFDAAPNTIGGITHEQTHNWLKK